MGERDFDKARTRLLEEIQEHAHETRAWTGRLRFPQPIVDAIAHVPRHAFVLPRDLDTAYLNRPRGIGHGQTISQPYIVAAMTDLLSLKPTDRVLEVGTGSGYQAAVLARLVAKVFSVEVIEPLATSARRRLESLGYANVWVRHGDGYGGWSERAPYDAVMVTAAPRAIPPALIEQLKPGGRIVVPVGRPDDTQTLYLGIKGGDGKLRTERVLPVAFVPMVPGTWSGRDGAGF